MISMICCLDQSKHISIASNWCHILEHITRTIMMNYNQIMKISHKYIVKLILGHGQSFSLLDLNLYQVYNGRLFV